MSIFTKRRKIVRQKQEEDRKCWEENSKKFGKGCEDTIKTCKYLQEHHPEFDSLDEEERVKLFSETFNSIHNNR